MNSIATAGELGFGVQLGPSKYPKGYPSTYRHNKAYDARLYFDI